MAGWVPSVRCRRGFDPETAILSDGETASFVPGLTSAFRRVCPNCWRWRGLRQREEPDHQPPAVRTARDGRQGAFSHRVLDGGTMDEISETEPVQAANEDLPTTFRYLVDRFAEVGSDVIVIQADQPGAEATPGSKRLRHRAGAGAIDFGWNAASAAPPPLAGLPGRSSGDRPTKRLGFRATD